LRFFGGLTLNIPNKMKKLILSAAVIASMTFFACSSDDDSNDDNNTTSGCVTCDAYSFSGFEMPAAEVCESAEGTAIVNGVDTGFPYDSYVDNQRTVTTCD